ncbi:hypothetical protein [Paraclostridium sordellii]|uniref:hypothetical protein n=1 Tax=Paraclostridium sordellii TaxID=1505 RepID=UPI0005DAB133|nr:hypothetical protein [Paeniclostridium sordellii]CEO20933.1 Uncharacterised protein [[Clostridium] sordellii] [Paeniclostridium sordellii]
MSEKIIIDGKEYDKLEILKIKVDGEDKEVNQIGEDDTKDKTSIVLNIVVDTTKK